MRVGESSPLLAETSGKIQVQLGARRGWVVALSKGKEGHQKSRGSAKKRRFPSASQFW